MNVYNFFRKKNECGEVRIIKKLLIILLYYVDLGKFGIDDYIKLVFVCIFLWVIWWLYLVLLYVV